MRPISHVEKKTIRSAQDSCMSAAAGATGPAGFKVMKRARIQYATLQSAKLSAMKINTPQTARSTCAPRKTHTSRFGGFIDDVSFGMGGVICVSSFIADFSPVVSAP